MTDMVNHPTHYTGHPIFTGECWDYAKELENGAEFSVFRYAWRWRNKFDPLEDLNKAGWYLDRLLEKHPHDRGPVNRTRVGRVQRLENALHVWRANTTSVGKNNLLDEWAAMVNINVMRGTYREAKYHLDNLIRVVTNEDMS